MPLKSTRYRKAEPASLNRRAAVRQAVQINRVSLKRKKSAPIAAKVVDISIYGCRLSVDAIMQEGETIEVQFESLEALPTSVIWQKGGEAGCRFESPISKTTMKALSPSN